MTTRHADITKARRDVEYWLKQGYAVGVLRPGLDDGFYTVYVNLRERG